jgi:cystathionine beta-lyase
MDKTRLCAAVVCAGAVVLVIYYRRRRRQTYSFDSSALDRRGYHTVKHVIGSCMSDRPGALNLWVADMDLPICEALHEAILQRARHPTFGYTIQPTVIWERAAHWLVEKQGWAHTPQPSAFVFSASLVSSFCNVLRALTDPGDGVVVMVPSYAPMQDVVKGSGRRLLLHSLRRQGCTYDMALDALQGLLDAEKPKVVLLINPHNPAGRVWSQPELAALAAVCACRGILVVSDEIWADWVFARGTFTPFATVAAAPLKALKDQPACKHITLNAPTKTFNLAGLHASYLIIEDPTLREQYLQHVAPGFFHYGSTFATVALLAAYEQGDEWVSHVRAHVSANLDFLAGALAASDLGVTALPVQATFLAWLDCAALVKRYRLEAPGALHKFFADDAGLVLSAGSEFDPTGQSDTFMRMNVACPRAVIVEAVERLRAAVARVDGHGAGVSR